MATAIDLPRRAAPLGLARLVALLVPLGLLAGALGFEYIGGLAPCEMCWWQRYAHAAALVPAALAFSAPADSGRSRLFVALAALAIAVSGAIGVFHAGVEIGWWEGLTRCTSSGAATLDDILAAPLVRCDVVPWSLGGISMAGWNAILSLGGAGVVAFLLTRRGA